MFFLPPSRCRKGSQYLHDDSDISVASEDDSDAVCAITISRVRARHFGRWKCRLLRRRTDGKQGSEALETEFAFIEKAKYKKAKLSKNRQGLQERKELRQGSRKDALRDRGACDVIFYRSVKLMSDCNPSQIEGGY